MAKKNVPYAILISFLLIGVLLFAAFFLRRGGDKDDSLVTKRVCVYYRAVSNTIAYEEYPLRIQDKNDMAGLVLSRFLEGPKSQNAYKSEPMGFSVIEPSIIRNVPERAESIFVINFTKEYLGMAPVDEMFFRSALVWTMTDLDFITNVEILVEDGDLNSSLGVAMGPLNRLNTDIYPVISPQKRESKEVKLYFADSTGTLLLPEKRTIDINPDMPLENFIMEEIIKGPYQEGLYATVSPDVKVRDVQNKDGICFVNLSGDFLNKGPALPISEDAVVYSIVNSLTEIARIKKVQFLIDSENVTEFRGLDLSRPFERNDGIGAE